MLAVLEQNFGEMRRTEQCVMPTATILGKVCTIARDRDIQNCEAPHGFLMSAREGECRRPPPVMTDQKELINSQVFVNQSPDVRSNGFLIESSGGTR